MGRKKMKFFNDRKIKTKILALVACLLIFMMALGAVSYSGLSSLDENTNQMMDQTTRVRSVNRVSIELAGLMYSEMSIPMMDDVETVRSAEVKLKEFNEVYDERMVVLRENATADQIKMLDDLEKRVDLFRSQIAVTLAEANSIYAKNEKEDDTDLKSSIVKNEQNAMSIEESLEALAVDYRSGIERENNEATESAKSGKMVIISMSTAATLFGMLFGYLLSSQGIAKPLARSVDVLKKLANNELDVEVKGADRKDEVGDVARAAEFFKESLIKQRDMVDAEKREQVLKEQRQKRVQELIQSFDINATQTVSTVASASTQLSQTAESMSKIADETNRQSVEVASASEQASHNVQSVASAAEEMAATVQEISRQIAISNNMVQDAMTKAEAADASSRELVDMSSAVGAIATLIEDIAGQINLLALNATIESARSGEAGKGFAVVANEVKNLATQTAKATEQIRQQLDGVQKTAVNVADVLLSVREAIGKVDETSATIAAAVEEQAAATQEIVSNMNTATQGVEQINGGIFSIKGGTDSTTAATREVLDAARMLSVQAEKMDGEVKSFLRDIQAA
ncbi:HAMP domain protein [Micavibrio aeruginosavorus ARL-13]|uniref:HAMP domain protein n=2 Tax=Micavibrio aeruginosavorus TaxID=349221 RepID=G2KPX4_MICAA|nr:HAMP domain protein [Micavibrio aeruginosavorus ARL-13]